MGSNLRTRYQRGSIDCGDCSPDFGDIFDCCDFDGCGNKKNHSPEFSAKSDRKNKQKYNPKASINEPQGVDLMKKD